MNRVQRDARRAIGLGFAVLIAVGCGRGDGGDPHGGEADAAFEKGPHGGRLLEDGSFAVELAIFERGVPPELRAWIFEDGKPADPAGVELDVTLHRLGGRVDPIRFAPRDGALVGDRVVDEPHSFDVDVVARRGDREHRFSFASYEGRVTLDAGQQAAGGIESARAGPARIRETLALNGRVAANGDALGRLAPRFPGVVRSVHKRIGDPVAAGDLLAVIESNQSLHPYELRARVAGTVIDKQVSPGEFVSNDRVLFAIADLSSVWVDLDVYRQDFGRLRIGQRVDVDTSDGTPPVQSAIAYLSPIGTPGTQTLLARAVLPNPDRSWRPGLFVTAEVELEAAEVPVAVRASALQRLRGWDVVFRSEGDVFEAQPVELGRRNAQWVEIVAGLSAGDHYAASGSFVLKADVGKAGATHDH